MKYDESVKLRQINYRPPLPIKEKIDLYAKGNRTQFITDAVKNEIARREQDMAKLSSVSECLK